jgi:hypothetical protein
MPWQRLRAYLLAICALAALVAASEETQSQGAWTQAGVLTCRLNPSIGFIIVGPSRWNVGSSRPDRILRKPTRGPSIRSVLTLA